MKTWTHVERRLERMRLPYRVQDETLVTLDGAPVAVTVQGARDFLSSPGHPDSKRQQRCKQRSLTRHGARVLKASSVTFFTVPKISKRQEIKAMRKRLEDDRKIMARAVADRLLGKLPSLSGWTSVDGVRYGK